MFMIGSEWRRNARCVGGDPDLFFSDRRPTKATKQVCATCPVRQECLELALESPWRPYGIFGGMSASELWPEWRARHPKYENNTADNAMDRLLGLA